MSLFSKNGKLILLHKNIKSPKKARVYDLLLSPQFYVVKKEAIPVKYGFQAKKLAPSILEDFLDDENAYKFIVEKKKNYWNFYAYNPKAIEDFLKKYNIQPNQINKIYFADQLSNILLKTPLELDENNALVLVDNYATIVPKEMIKTNKYLKFSKKLRPKKGFRFINSQKASKKDKELLKGAIVASLLLLALATFYFIEGFSYKKENKKIQDSLTKLYEDSPELSSKLTQQAIKKKYLSIENEQRKIRELINTFSAFSSKKTILQDLELQKNSVIAKYSVDKNELKRLKSLITSKGLNYKEKGNLLLVTGELK